MPTYDQTARFRRDWESLSPAQRRAFRIAIGKFVEDLRSGRGFRRGLRVKGVRGAPRIYEMSWADDGRATFQYGKEHRAGDPHIVWRRCGTHDVLRSP